jgi:hypothetical protein
MYSHKRSFTGQSSRSLGALFDVPFLTTVAALAALFSFAHSALTFYKLDRHTGVLPEAMKHIPEAELISALKSSTSILDFDLIVATWVGLCIPLFIMSIAVRWALASLRISVQRTVTLCYLMTFYFCSFMTVALHNPGWTPGNLLVRALSPLGEGFFESLRALLWMSLAAAAIYTLAKNATSKINWSVRLTSIALLLLGFLTFDYLYSKNSRSVHESFLKNPPSTTFVFILPGLKRADVPLSLADKKLNSLREQLSSFQEIHPSTPSLLGQFATSLLGIEPVSHGLRHDFMPEEIISNVRAAFAKKVVPAKEGFFAAAIGGASPLDMLLEASVPGERCGQELSQIARLGHFQASVIPYSLTPRQLDRWINPLVVCSSRFLTVDQHMFHVYQQVVLRLHQPGAKTFFIWLSPGVENSGKPSPTEVDSLASWSKSTFMIHTVLKNHLEFLDSSGLKNHHQTFVLGLADADSTSTAFVRFDGQTKSELTDLTLESPGQKAQSSVAELLRGLPSQNEKDSPLFYSEFNLDPKDTRLSKQKPTVLELKAEQTKRTRLIVDNTLLRKNIVNTRRHVICQNVASSTGKRMYIRVSLALRSDESRLPQLTYEDFQKTDLPPQKDAMSLDDCLTNAREKLMKSIVEDVTLRDSSAFKTLLMGLPVKSIMTSSTLSEPTPESEEIFDQSTSALPDSASGETEQ